MKTLIIGKKRRDGKYPVTIRYQGEPNMFGGRYPGKEFRKLYTRERLAEYTLYPEDTLINNSGEDYKTFNIEEIN